MEIIAEYIGRGRVKWGYLLKRWDQILANLDGLSREEESS